MNNEETPAVKCTWESRCGRVTVCQNDKLPLHVCPFQAEIAGNYNPICDCCQECMDECADDV